MSAFRAFVSGPFYKIFNNAFMGNIKAIKKMSCFFLYPYKFS